MATSGKIVSNITASKTARMVAFLIAVALATGCEAPDPTPAQTVPYTWGDNITPTHSDILYVPGGTTGCATGSDHTCGGSQELDIYPAVESIGGNRGVIVYFHGGGFVTGNKAPMSHTGNIMRQTHRGFSVVSVNYRLADHTIAEDGFQDTIDDVAASINWVFDNDGQYGLNTDTVLVAGGSAGGTLATLAGTTWNSPDPAFADMPRVHGWIESAGILDWRNGPKSERWIERWLGTGYGSKRDLASPVNHIDMQDPPGYVIHGIDDGFVEPGNATDLQAELERQQQAGESLLNYRITVDVVDNFADGTPMASNTGHSPMGGANSWLMDVWINDRAAKKGDYPG